MSGASLSSRRFFEKSARRRIGCARFVLAGSLGEAGRNKAMGASSPMCECAPSTNNNAGPASSNLSPIEILEGTAPTEDPNVASLYNPCGVAVCPMGERVYIADTGHHRICVLERGGLRVLAGSGTRGFADGASAKAAFS